MNAVMLRGHASCVMVVGLSPSFWVYFVIFYSLLYLYVVEFMCYAVFAGQLRVLSPLVVSMLPSSPLSAMCVSRPLCPSDPWVLQVCVSVCVMFRLAPLLLISWFCSPVPCFPQLCPDDLVCISALYFPQFFVVISLISQLCALPVCLVPLFPSLVFCNTLVLFDSLCFGSSILPTLHRFMTSCGYIWLQHTIPSLL